MQHQEKEFPNAAEAKLFFASMLRKAGVSGLAYQLRGDKVAVVWNQSH